MEKDIHLFHTACFASKNDITIDEETQSLVKNKGTFHYPLSAHAPPTPSFLPLEIEAKRLILLLII